MNIQELLQLAGEQGKVVIVDDKGELKAVLLSGEEYKSLAQLPSQQEEAETEAEKINREILQAQLEEVMGLPALFQPMPDPAERIDTILSKRAEDLFRSIPAQPAAHPYANFTAPDVSSSNDEEIKPNFDDI